MFSPEEFNEIIRKAEQGDKNAQNKLYNYGLALRRGVHKNLQKAIEVWRKAVDFDIPEAAGNLAELYENGSNDTGDNKIEPNIKEAAKYYSIAADILEKMLESNQLANEADVQNTIKFYREKAAYMAK